jgi:hypothetical protein
MKELAYVARVKAESCAVGAVDGRVAEPRVRGVPWRMVSLKATVPVSGAVP